MDDKQLLEENFLSFDYTKPEENEKRKEYLLLKHNKLLSNSNNRSINSINRNKVLMHRRESLRKKQVIIRYFKLGAQFF